MAQAPPLTVIFHVKLIGAYQEDGEVCEHHHVTIISYHKGHHGHTD